jgi:phage replication O-like protein O
METPQLEDGYIRIATNILKAIARTQFNGYEIRYLMVLFYKTYGFHKKSDKISNSQFVSATGLHKQHIWRTEQRLINRRIVTKSGYFLSFQKDSRLWCELPKMVTVTKSGIGVTKSGGKVTKSGGYKRYITKDTYTKDIVNSFIGSFKKVNPSYQLLFKNITQRLAADRLVKKYGETKLTNLMNQLPEIIKRPYAPSITTPYELEAKMGKLLVFLSQEKNKIKKMEVTKL